MQPFNDDNPLTDAQDDSLRSALSNSYPAIESSNSGRARVADLATRYDSAHPIKPTLWQRLTRPRMLVVATFSVGAMACGYYLMHRPGEEAIRLMPADALVVATLDASPSPMQTPLFLRINEALKREGMDGKVNKALSDTLSHSSISRELRSHLTSSFGLALLESGKGGGGTDNAEPVLYLAVRDGGALDAALTKDAPTQHFSGLGYHSIKANTLFGGQTSAVATVLSGYLIIAEKPATLLKVANVAAGRNPSVADLAEYKQARAALPLDAHFMLFVSPRALSEADKASGKMGMHAFRNTRWMALSATLEEKGIKFDFRGPTDLKVNAPSNPPVAALNDDAFRHMPEGAYGVIGVSQPGRYYPGFIASVFEDKAGRAAWDRDLKEFEQFSGLSVERDILPAFQGNAWLGVYPDTKGPAGVGLIVMMDDSHGGDPAGLFIKGQEALKRISSKENRKRLQAYEPMTHTIEWLTKMWSGDLKAPDVPDDMPGKSNKLKLNNNHSDSSDTDHGMWDEIPSLVAHKENGITIWTLDEKTHKQLVEAAKSQDDSLKADGFDPMVAQVGKSMIWASSRNLLNHAIAAAMGQGRTLFDDPSMAGMRKSAISDPQNVFMVNLRMIMDQLRPTLTKQLKKASSGITVDDVIGLFGEGDTGLVVASKYDGLLLTGSCFVPLDYERAIRLIGRTKDGDLEKVTSKSPDYINGKD